MKTALKRKYLLQLFARQEGQCCYCGGHVILSYRWRDQQRPDAATIEHLQRLADGGSNHPDNLAMSCKRCNDGRQELDWLTYRSLKRGEIHKYARSAKLWQTAKNAKKCNEIKASGGEEGIRTLDTVSGILP